MADTSQSAATTRTDLIALRESLVEDWEFWSAEKYLELSSPNPEELAEAATGATHEAECKSQAEALRAAANYLERHCTSIKTADEKIAMYRSLIRSMTERISGLEEAAKKHSDRKKTIETYQVTFKRVQEMVKRYKSTIKWYKTQWELYLEYHDKFTKARESQEFVSITEEYTTATRDEITITATLERIEQEE